MRKAAILIVFSILYFLNSNVHAQDVAFTQWENMPLHLNPALTGDFEGTIRIRTKYRNQFPSLLKNGLYQTGAGSFEYKFTKLKQSEISLGFYSLFDKAGTLNLRKNSFNLSGSVIQNLGDTESSHHAIGIGVSAGLVNRKIDYENVQWPGGVPIDLENNTNFADVSVGLNWQYRTNTHFSYQLGSAIHHVNRPNVSFSETNVEKHYLRFNVHGNVEIPIIDKISLVPSCIFYSQGPTDQFLFGLAGKWYPKSTEANFVQLGFLGKTTKNINQRDVNVYVISAQAEIKSILFGFSFDHFRAIGDNAYEVSLGYTFGRKSTSSILEE